MRTGGIVPQFVVVYDRVSGKSLVRQFDGPSAEHDALAARFEAEFEADRNTEIASLAAASLDELKVTHSRYFRTSSEIVDDFRKLIAS
jgi:hypothetical protein